MKKLNITVVGVGYVGLSNAMLFSKKHNIIALDIDSDRVDKLNNKISPIRDELIQKYLNEAENFSATLESKVAYENSDIIIIATPTNYDEQTNYFDTSSIENILEELSSFVCKSIIIIKSTIPVGFTKKMQSKYPYLNIIFSPEFLREGLALYDNLYPSRIVIGDISDYGRKIGELFKSSCLKEDVNVLCMESTEAEAVKLFSNTYLAMRVSYFNELDTYCMLEGLNTKDIIEAISLDPRIGHYYNNPSFGYGGYCLPKDTKQLLKNYDGIPQELISSIIRSNSTRKNFIVEQILLKQPKIVGIYRLIMKAGSDNFRQSAIQDIIEALIDKGISVKIYEPSLGDQDCFLGEVLNDLDDFKQSSDLIVANRIVPELYDAMSKVFTRDIFHEN